VFIRVHPWLKQKPHRRLAVGFDKSRERIRTQPPRGTTAARSATGSNCNSQEETNEVNGNGQMILFGLVFYLT
jgi:hypothetical protein